MALTAAQKKALARRTTPTSRSRLLASIQARQPTITPTDAFSTEADILERALGRGYGYKKEDFGITRERGTFDFQQGQGDINRQRGEGLQDIATQRSRGTEDYDKAISDLQRRYGQLGSSQNERAGIQGVRYGGTLRSAAKKRAENQALDKAPLDTQQSRSTEDLNTNTTRLNQGSDRALGDLAKQYERGFGSQGDLTLQEQRAGSEFTIANQDLDQQRIAAAVNSGFIPPTPAKVKVKPKPKKKRR